MYKFVLISASLLPTCFGQLPPDQKVAEFMQLSGLYAKHYAPYEWKKQVFGFDLLDVKPWMEKVRNFEGRHRVL